MKRSDLRRQQSSPHRAVDEQLGEADRAKLTELLNHGCTYEEILQHFLLRGSSPDRSRTELAKRVKKMSKGKGLSKSEIIEIIRLQLDQESQEALDQMLEKGFYQDDVITHFMMKGKTCDEAHREIADKLSKLIDVDTMSEKEIIDTITDQLKKLPFYHSFAGKTANPAINLAEHLIKISPVPMSKVFFANCTLFNNSDFQMHYDTLLATKVTGIRFFSSMNP
mgnify:CR=1 FL=1